MARILIVEDDADTQQMLARRLTSYGHVVTAAPSARLAMNVVGFDFAPDVVLLDVGLPCTNGFELLLQLRRHPELDNPRLPAVFLSGSTDPESIARGKSMGATYLCKPFVGSELRAAIENAIIVNA